MMNMNYISSLESCNSKPYIWKKEWVRLNESIFGIILNFCKVNAFSGQMAIRKLKEERKKILSRTNYKCRHGRISNYIEDYRHAWYSHLLPKWYFPQMQLFLNMTKYTKEELYDTHLQICPECIKVGYHSYGHQIINARTCYIHDIPLIRTSYKMDEEYIVYDKDTDKFCNARDLIHPALRPRMPGLNTPIWLQRRYSYVGHYITMDRCIYLDFRKNNHSPYIFLVMAKYSWHKRLKSWSKDDEGLISGLKSGQKGLPYAVKQYLDDNDKENRMDDIYMSSDTILPYFLYCLSWNFIRKESRKSNVSSADLATIRTLHKEDTALLKYSFLWVIKDSIHPVNVLSRHCIIFPTSAENDPHRRTSTNGACLQDIYTEYRIPFLSKIDCTILNLFIINDLFHLLWKQYVELAKRPEGVNVWDGWKDLVIPEYFVCVDNEGKFIDLYRLDP